MKILNRTKKSETVSTAPSEDVAAAVAEIERGNTTPTPAPEVPTVAPGPTKPAKAVHVVQDGLGAFVWRRTGDHAVQTVWDPMAKQIEPTPLPLGADIRSILFVLASRHGVDRQGFIAYCNANRGEVRAAYRAYTLDGGQWNAFDNLVREFRNVAT